MRSLNNFRAEQPHQHAMYYLRLLMTEVAWTKDELKEALDGNVLPVLNFIIFIFSYGKCLVTKLMKVPILNSLPIIQVKPLQCQTWADAGGCRCICTCPPVSRKHSSSDKRPQMAKLAGKSSGKTWTALWAWAWVWWINQHC